MGSAPSSGGGNSKSRAFEQGLFRLARLGHQDANGGIAVEPLADLEIEACNVMDPLLHQGDTPKGTPYPKSCHQHRNCRGQSNPAEDEPGNATEEKALGFRDEGREPRQPHLNTPNDPYDRLGQTPRMVTQVLPIATTKRRDES